MAETDQQTKQLCNSKRSEGDGCDQQKNRRFSDDDEKNTDTISIQ